MKYIYFPLFILSLFLVCCESDTKTPSSRTTIRVDTTIKNYQNFYYNLGGLKDHEGTGISLKPKHAKINEVYSDSSTGEIMYVYKAIPVYVGKDFVELYRERGQEGSDVHVVDTIKINLTIEAGL